MFLILKRLQSSQTISGETRRSTPERHSRLDPKEFCLIEVTSFCKNYCRVPRFQLQDHSVRLQGNEKYCIGVFVSGSKDSVRQPMFT